MISNGCYTLQVYTPSLDDAAGRLLHELKSFTSPTFSDFIQFLRKHSGSNLYVKTDINVFKSLYQELRVKIEEFQSIYPYNQEEEKLLWVKFYQDLSKVLNFKENFDLWNTAAFALLEESLDRNEESTSVGDFLNLLVHLMCFHDEIQLEVSSIPELKSRYQSQCFGVYFALLATSSHKPYIISALTDALRYEKEVLISDESMLSLCKQALHTDVSLEALIRLFQQFKITKSVIPEVVQCLFSKLDKGIKIRYEAQVFIIGLIVKKECREYWFSIKESILPLFLVEVDYSRELVVHPSPLAKDTLFKILHFWMVLIEDGNRTVETQRCIFQYFFMSLDQQISQLSFCLVKDLLGQFHSITKELVEVEEFKDCVGLSLLYFTHIAKIHQQRTEKDGFALELFSYLVSRFAETHIEPRHLQKGLSIYISKHSSSELNSSFCDQYKLLVELFGYSAFEERRDLAFMLSSSRDFSDDFADLVKVCPTPVLYLPPIIENYLFKSFKKPFIQVFRSFPEKEALFTILKMYFSLSDSQMSQLITWIVESVNDKKQLTLQEYSDFLHLLCTCLSCGNVIKLSDIEISKLIGSLKPSMYICDFRLMFKKNDPDPKSSYLGPTLEMLESIIETLELKGNHIIESHYFYWNAAITLYLTKILPNLFAQAIRKKSNKRPGKLFGVYPSLRIKHLKSVERLPFDALKKNLIIVGNHCMQKLTGNPLYERCTHLYDGSV